MILPVRGATAAASTHYLMTYTFFYENNFIRAVRLKLGKK